MTAPRHRSHAPVLAVRGGLDYGIPPASSSAGVICQAMFGLAYTPAEEAFRVELRAWLEANLPRAPAPEEEGERRRFQRAWQRALAAGGWVGIQWPRAHGGRGASLHEQIIFTEEMARAQAPEILDPVSVNIVGPTLIRFGTPAQQARWLPPIRAADQVWCLGFSEPNAGSDLASLRCRARRDGDHWVVSGQKVWSSKAHFADWCLLLVRSDPEARRPGRLPPAGRAGLDRGGGVRRAHAAHPAAAPRRGRRAPRSRAPEALRERDPAAHARAGDGDCGPLRAARARRARPRRRGVGRGIPLLALGHHLVGHFGGAAQPARAAGPRPAARQLKGGVPWQRESSTAGQRLPELDPGAARAHRPGARGEGAHPGRERGRVLPAAGLSMADDELGARLERFVGERLGAPARVTHLERSTEGFSQATFVFDVELGRERRGYVAKREPVAGLLEPYDLEPEFRVLHALSEDPLPSPPTPWFTRDPSVLERPFYVMERLPGEVPIPVARVDGAGPFDDAERAALGPEVAHAPARLHAIDWRARGFQFLGVPRPGREAAERELARWEERIRRSGLPVSPPLAEALLWCRRHAPATDAITLVHGDYRLR